MNLLLLIMPLASLDRVSKLSAIRQGFERESGNSTYLLGGLLAAAAICGLLVVVSQIVQQGRTSRAADYLPRAARLLGLSRGETRDVRLVARLAQHPHPAAMLLTPANLAHAVSAALRHKANARLRQRLNQLSVRLFGRQLPPPTSD